MKRLLLISILLLTFTAQLCVPGNYEYRFIIHIPAQPTATPSSTIQPTSTATPSYTPTRTPTPSITPSATQTPDSSDPTPTLEGTPHGIEIDWAKNTSPYYINVRDNCLPGKALIDCPRVSINGLGVQITPGEVVSVDLIFEDRLQIMNAAGVYGWVARQYFDIKCYSLYCELTP